MDARRLEAKKPDSGRLSASCLDVQDLDARRPNASKPDATAATTITSATPHLLSRDWMQVHATSRDANTCHES